MTIFQKLTLLFLRLSLGWIFLYAGITKIMNPGWSAEGYLKSAQTLPWLFSWFTSPQNIGWVNFLNSWGQTLIGTSLILGVFIKIAAPGAILMMVLYYLPILHFPYVGRGTTSFIVDQHFIFTLVLLLLWAHEDGNYWSLKPLLKKYLPKHIQAVI